MKVVYLLMSRAAEPDVITCFRAECEPRVVTYTDAPPYNTLKVDLHIENPPHTGGAPMVGLDYAVIAYTVEGGRLIKKYHIATGASYDKTIQIEQNLYRSWANCEIGYCLYDERQPGCDLNKDKIFRIISLQYSNDGVENSDCIAGKCEITLDLNTHCANTAEDPGAPSDVDRPMIKIHEAVDEGPLGTGSVQHLIIKCSAEAENLDFLLIYQDYQDSHRRQGRTPKLLKKGQYIGGRRHFELAVNKTLVDADKDSKIYCVKRRASGESRDSNVEYIREYDYMFLPSEESAEVVVVPDIAEARFGREEPVGLVCRGTPPRDGRSLTWYIRDEHTSEIEVPDGSSQHYNPELNENKLNIMLNDSYDSKVLFCAQDRHVRVHFADGSSLMERYDVQQTSIDITLKLIQDEDNARRNTIVVCGALLGAAALASAAALVRGRRQENLYTTVAEVTYAQLDLPQPHAATATRTGSTSPYAEVVGVYNPRRKN